MIRAKLDHCLQARDLQQLTLPGMSSHRWRQSFLSGNRIRQVDTSVVAQIQNQRIQKRTLGILNACYTNRHKLDPRPHLSVKTGFMINPVQRIIFSNPERHTHTAHSIVKKKEPGSFQFPSDHTLIRWESNRWIIKSDNLYDYKALERNFMRILMSSNILFVHRIKFWSHGRWNPSASEKKKTEYPVTRLKPSIPSGSFLSSFLLFCDQEREKEKKREERETMWRSCVSRCLSAKKAASIGNQIGASRLLSTGAVYIHSYAHSLFLTWVKFVFELLESVQGSYLFPIPQFESVSFLVYILMLVVWFHCWEVVGMILVVILLFFWCYLCLLIGITICYLYL